MNHRIARTGMCSAILFTSFFSCAAATEFGTISGQTLEDTARWTASGGVTSFRFDLDLLKELQISIRGPARAPSSEMPGELEFSIDADTSLDIWAPRAAWDGFADGAFSHTGQLTIEWPGGRIKTDGFSLRPAAADALKLVDDHGNPLFRLDYIHTMLYPNEKRMTLWNMGVTISPWLANRMGHPELAGFGIAAAFTQVSLAIPMGAQTEGTCTSPNWHDGETFFTNVELIGLGSMENGVQTMARQEGVRVAVAGDAMLRNAGSADVPWYPKFRTEPPATFEQYPDPYSRDQHPFLVWAMYRIVDDIPQQIGQSAVKHAFFAQNNNCACSGGNILWSADSAGGGEGCTDLYHRFTNDDPEYLGIREELPAFTGEFEQCGSMFAPLAEAPGPCVEEFDGNTSDEFERRMVIEESALGVEDGIYFFEAWYVVRDDVDIFNSMGHKSVTPTLDTTWTFPGGNDFTQGPAIDAWVPPNTSEAMQAHTVETTANGHYSLAVKVTDIGGGMFRYVYALMNYDFDPKFNAFAVPLPAGANVANVQYLDGDSNGANDWISSMIGGELAWTAPDSASALEWGFMATFVFEADQAPVAGLAGLTAEEKPLNFSPVTLGPTPALDFQQGFEDPN